MTTNQITIKKNFDLLCKIMDVDFGVIECNGIIDPNDKIFKKQIEKQ
jgi:hypothetical protein